MTFARRLSLISATALMLIAPSPVWADFGGPELVDPQLYPDEMARDHRQLVGTPNGTALWQSQEFKAGDRRVTVAERCGTPSTWPIMPLTAFGDDYEPRGIAAAEDGGVLAVWREYLGSGDYRFSSSYRPPNGTTWEPAQTILEGEHQSISGFAVGNGGQAIVGWSEAAATNVKLRSAAGVWGAPTTLEAEGQIAEVAMSAAGDAALLTHESAPAQAEAYYRPAGGSWGGVEEVEGLNYQTPLEGMHLEFTGTGLPVAVFSQRQQTDMRLYASVRSGGGWQTTATVLDETYFASIATSVTRTPTGVAVAWRRVLSQQNHETQIGVTRLSASGWEAPKIYAPAGAISAPTVSTASDGRTLLAAERFYDDGPTERVEIWGTIVDAATPWPADLTRLSPQGDATHQYWGAHSAAAGSRLFLAWGIHGQPGGSSSVIGEGAAMPCAGTPPGPGPIPPTPDPGNPDPPPGAGIPESPSTPLAGSGTPGAAPAPMVLASTPAFGSSATKLTVKKNVFVVSVKCVGPTGAPACTGELRAQSAQKLGTGKSKRRVSLASAKLSFPAGKSVDVKLKLTSAARKAIGRRTKLATVLELRASAAATKPLAQMSVTLRR